MLVLLTILNLLTSSNAVTFFLVVPDGSISGQLGSSVVLPCTLSPSQDCREFEILWYRNKDRDNPVLLYKDLKVQENAGDPQYRGRVSLVGDLKKGNVSLKLENLTVADRGEYVCFVDRTKWYDQASVFITVPVVGSPPLQSLTEVGDQVNVTCESDGWSPKPTLTWRDRSGKELWNSPKYYTQDSEGLVSVRSWLMFSPSDSEWISCSVGLSDQEMKEGRVLILNSVSKTLQSGVSAGWKVAFLVLLAIFVVVISLLIFLMIRDHVWRKPSKPPKIYEETPLFVEASPSDHGVTQPLDSAPRDEVPDLESSDEGTDEQTQDSNKDNTTAAGSAPRDEVPDLESSDEGTDEQTQEDSNTNNPKRNKEKERPDWNMMRNCKVAIQPESETRQGVLFKERIRAGQYYWEVIGLTETSVSTTSLRTNQQNKCPESWYVGVLSETVLKNQLQLSPQNCWVLCYDNENRFYVNDPSLPPVPVKDWFFRLGVFIDCEKNTLSFYNCDKSSHLYTFYNVDCTQPLVPVVFPGLRPQYSLDISTFSCVKCDELLSTT